MFKMSQEEVQKTKSLILETLTAAAEGNMTILLEQTELLDKDSSNFLELSALRSGVPTTPLATAVFYRQPLASIFIHLMLLKQNRQPTHSDFNGISPLTWAVRSENELMFALLLALGHDVNSITEANLLAWKPQNKLIKSLNHYIAIKKACMENSIDRQPGFISDKYKPLLLSLCDIRRLNADKVTELMSLYKDDDKITQLLQYYLQALVLMEQFNSDIEPNPSKLFPECDWRFITKCWQQANLYTSKICETSLPFKSS